jgi:hypothetical protein
MEFVPRFPYLRGIELFNTSHAMSKLVVGPGGRRTMTLFKVSMTNGLLWRQPKSTPQNGGSLLDLFDIESRSVKDIHCRDEFQWRRIESCDPSGSI